MTDAKTVATAAAPAAANVTGRHLARRHTAISRNNEHGPLLSVREESKTRGPIKTGKKWSRKPTIQWLFFVVSVCAVLLGSFLLWVRSRFKVSRSGNFLHGPPPPGRWSTGSTIRPGADILDTRGARINAHGGGFLLHAGTYYWYGEIKTGRTYLPAVNADWGGSRIDLTGISCYASRDLLHWENHGNVLPAVRDPEHDLYVENVAERPKVVYNARTATFVMWLHIDSMDYKKARCGVATSDRPDGPFEYVGSFRPNGGQMARDLTVFVDDDARRTAYLFTSSEENAVTHIAELSDDYLSTTGNHTRAFVGRYMEAPAVFKRRGRYYFVASGCSGWTPNAARSAVASSVRGPWTELGNPCLGEEADSTFRAQSTDVVSMGGDRFLFAADRWNAQNLSESRYVWLPFSFEEDTGSPIIRWHDEWSPALPEVA